MNHKLIVKAIKDFRSTYDPDMDYQEVLNLIRKYSKEVDNVISPVNTYFPEIDARFHSISEIRDYRSGVDINQQFQFFNKEFNDTLFNQLNIYKNVLEVGAGNGMLTHVLRKRGLSITACDDFSWKQSYKKYCPDMLRMNYEEALKKVSPDCVISCWMPYGENWSIDIRKTPSVKAYFIIGEEAGGCTGTKSLFNRFKGWHKKELKTVQKWGLCRTDRYIVRFHNTNYTRVFKYSRLYEK